MAVKKVVVHPGDLLDIHVVRDKELPATLTEWKEQVRPPRFLVTVAKYEHLQFTVPHTITLELVDLHRKTIKYLQ
jgi:protein involved in polysaccharide export with SLBB domain